MINEDAQLPKLPQGYEYVKKLATGGQGVVWLVRNGNMGSPGRHEAVKILLDKADFQDVTIQRFYQEINTLAALSHPNIVTIYYANPKESYFIMEYLDGGTLSGFMEERKLTLPDSLSILKQVMDGLQVAHGKNLIHRDLKPQNILFSSTGIPKITDFGLAKQQQLEGDKLTATQSFVGTPYYMAPEQWLDSTKIDHRADIWALGVILYEMLAERHPFHGAKGMGLMYATLSSPIEPPSRFRQLDDLGKAVEAVCMRALEKDLGKRYQNVYAMGIELGKTINCESPRQLRIQTPLFEDKLSLKDDMDDNMETLADVNTLPPVQKIDLIETIDNKASLAAKRPERPANSTIPPQAGPAAGRPKLKAPNGPSALTPGGERTGPKRQTQPMPAPAKSAPAGTTPTGPKPQSMPAPAKNAPAGTAGHRKPQRQAVPVPATQNSPDYLNKILRRKNEIAIVAGLFALALTLYLFLKTPGVSQLEKRIRNGDETAQLESLELLQKYGDSEALRALIAALDSKYSRVRKNAVNRVGGMGRSGAPDVLETLEEGFPECREEGKISVLDVIAKIDDRASTKWLRDLIHTEESSLIRQSAIQCLLSIDPACESDYSEYRGQWYGNWYLEDKGYVRIEKQWHDPEEYLEKAKPAQIEARRLLQNLEERRGKYPPFSHPDDIDLSEFSRCLARHREVVEKTAPLLPHLGKSRVDELLGQFHDETARGVISLFGELAKLGEDLARSGPIYTLVAYGKIEELCAAACSWQWVESSRRLLRDAGQRHRRSMLVLSNSIPQTPVVVPGGEIERQIQKAIRYAWVRNGQLPRFVEEAEDYYDVGYLFSFSPDSRDLSPGTASATLIEAFELNGRTLASDATLESAGDGCVIQDPKIPARYLALPSDGTVDVYERRIAQKWCVVEYLQDGSEPGCLISFWYAPPGGEKTRVWEQRIQADPPVPAAEYPEIAAQESLLVNLRLWQPPWQQIAEQCEPKNAGPEIGDQKVKGSTWETAQDIVYLTNGQELRGLVKEETDDYLILLYSFRPSKGSMQLATQKIFKNKIKSVERIDAETRKRGLQELEDRKKNQLQEAQDILSLRLNSIQWPFSGGPGWEYRSERFVLMSNAPADFVRQVAYSVNEIFRAYESFFRVARNRDQKITIYVFNSMQEYYGATGGQILNPAFYMPGKNLIAAGCDLQTYAAKVSEIRNYHENLRQQIEKQRGKVEQHKREIRASKKEQLSQLDNALRMGQINRDQYDSALRSLRSQEREIQKEINRYQKELAKLEDEMRSMDYRNKKIVAEYSELMLKTLYHEAFHAFLDNFLFEEKEKSCVPLWLNEGMAQFFENSFTEGNQLYIGKMDARRVKLLKSYIQKGKTVSLNQFLLADSDQFLVRDQSDLENSSIHYLQSWAIVYYLAQQYDLRKGNFFNQYVKDLRSGATSPLAFQRLVEMPLEEFDKKWKDALLKWK